MTRHTSSSEVPLAERLTGVVSDAKAVKGWGDAFLGDTAETLLTVAEQQRLRTYHSVKKSPMHKLAAKVFGTGTERHLETYALRNEIDAANLQSFAERPEIDPLNIVALLSGIAVSSWETDYDQREIGLVDQGVHLAQHVIADATS